MSLQEETIVPKQNLPPLLVPVCERSPEKIDYIGASFGLTDELFRFWKKHGFLPFYISRNPVIVLTISLYFLLLVLLLNFPNLLISIFHAYRMT